MRVMALDVGTKTIGVAVGNTETRLPRPLLTLSRNSVKKDVVRLLEHIQKEKSETIIIGLPLQLDGTEGRSARLARQIGDGISQALSMPVFYQDESYSTVRAQEKMISSGKSAAKRKKIIDQAAAAIILERWFYERFT